MCSVCICIWVIPSEISKFFPVSNSNFVETFTECLFNIVIVII